MQRLAPFQPIKLDRYETHSIYVYDDKVPHWRIWNRPVSGQLVLDILKGRSSPTAAGDRSIGMQDDARTYRPNWPTNLLADRPPRRGPWRKRIKRMDSRDGTSSGRSTWLRLWKAKRSTAWTKSRRYQLAGVFFLSSFPSRFYLFGWEPVAYRDRDDARRGAVA